MWRMSTTKLWTAHPIRWSQGISPKIDASWEAITTFATTYALPMTAPELTSITPPIKDIDIDVGDSMKFQPRCMTGFLRWRLDEFPVASRNTCYSLPQWPKSGPLHEIHFTNHTWSLVKAKFTIFDLFAKKTLYWNNFMNIFTIWWRII